MSRASLPNKITILRLSAIGDVLMLLPAVRLLKRQFPDTQIDWLIDRPIASLIDFILTSNRQG
jgi:heptosyltransferase I